MQVSGSAGAIKSMIDELRNTKNVDKVDFITAPFRESGCC
jgi:hypothetical protein